MNALKFKIIVMKNYEIHVFREVFDLGVRLFVSNNVCYATVIV